MLAGIGSKLWVSFALVGASPVLGQALPSSPHPVSPLAEDVGNPWRAVEIAPGVHSLVTAPGYYGPAVGNVTIIEQSDGLVVIDSGLTAGDGRAVVAYAKSLSPKPIKAIAITHWHNDHPQGVSSIRDAFPEVRIIATEATEAGMLGAEAFDVDYKPSKPVDDAMTKQIADYRVQLQKLLDDPATAPDRKERVRRAMVQNDRFLESFRGTYIVPPTETFRNTLALDDRIRPVELKFIGKANTDGDMIAWLPRERVLVSGDIVVAPTPYGFGSFAANWIETLGKLKAMNFKTLVPGHGDPQTDTVYLDKLIATIGDIRAKVGPLAKAGVPVEEVKGKVDWTDIIARFGDTPRNKAVFEQLFLDPMIPNVYKEAIGKPIVQGEGGPAATIRPLPPKPSSKRHST